MKATSYRQCLLERPSSDGGIVRIVSYIPEPFCKAGKVLKLRDGETWTDGWTVLSAGPTVEAATAEANERDWVRQRQASDRLRSSKNG